MAKAATMDGHGGTVGKYPVVEGSESHFWRNLGLGVAGAATLAFGGFKALDVSPHDVYNNIVHRTEIVENGVKMPTSEFKLQDFADAVNEHYVRLGEEPISASQVYAIKKLSAAGLKELASRDKMTVKHFMENWGYKGEGYLATFSRDNERPSPDGVFGEGYHAFFVKDGELFEHGRAINLPK